MSKRKAQGVCGDRVRREYLTPNEKLDKSSRQIKYGGIAQLVRALA